jgi:hypothetical protein
VRKLCRREKVRNLLKVSEKDNLKRSGVFEHTGGTQVEEFTEGRNKGQGI